SGSVKLPCVHDDFVNNATTADAASSSVATQVPGASGRAAAPRQHTTTGLPVDRIAVSRAGSTDGDGGLEMTTMASVRGSRPGAAGPASVIVPPPSPERSRPPTPMPCETPSPSAARRLTTACSPVPDAATQPTRPRGTTLANPRPTPAR